MQTATRSIGGQLRDWRLRRRLSQLALACEADISARHLSFVETGRSLPSREMVLRLAERLEVPLRERNPLLVAAGYAPVYPERPLQDPALAAARKVVDLVLAGHEPYPALAVDRHWTIMAANGAFSPLLTGIEPTLLHSPANALRIGLHPAGLAPRIANFAEWRAHLLARLQRQIDLTGDPALASLLNEISEYPHPNPPLRAGEGRVGEGGKFDRPFATAEYDDIVVPLRLTVDGEVLSLISMTTVFGTPVDITLSEIAIEAFLPADTATGEALRRLASAA
jgi:transcriptional regulator with XRE-family HTH domain